MFKVRTPVDEATWEKARIYLQAVLMDGKSREEAMALAMTEEQVTVGCKEDLYHILMNDGPDDMTKYTKPYVQLNPCIQEMGTLYNKAKNRQVLSGVNDDFFYTGKNNQHYFMKDVFLGSQNKMSGKKYEISSESTGILFRSTVPRYLDFMKFIGQLYAFYGALEDATQIDEMRTLTNDIEKAKDVDAIRDAVNPERRRRREEAERLRQEAEAERLRQEEAEAAEQKRRQEEAEAERLRQEEQRLRQEAAAEEQKRREQEYLSTENDRKRVNTVTVFSSLLPNLRTWYNIAIPEARVQEIFDDMKKRDAIIYLWSKGNDAGPMNAGMDDSIRQRGIDSGNLEEFVTAPSLTVIMREREAAEQRRQEEAAAEERRRQEEEEAAEQERMRQDEIERQRKAGEKPAPLPVPIPKEGQKLLQPVWSALTAKTADAVTKEQILAANFERDIDPIKNIAVIKQLATTLGGIQVSKTSKIGTLKNRIREKMEQREEVPEDTEEEEDERPAPKEKEEDETEDVIEPVEIDNIKALTRYNKQQVDVDVEALRKLGASTDDIEYVQTTSNAPENMYNLSNSWHMQFGAFSTTADKFKKDLGLLTASLRRLSYDNILDINPNGNKFFKRLNHDALKLIAERLRLDEKFIENVTKNVTYNEIERLRLERGLVNSNLMDIAGILETIEKTPDYPLSDLTIEIKEAIRNHWPLISTNGVWSEVFDNLQLSPDADIETTVSNLPEEHRLRYLHCLSTISSVLHHVEMEEAVPTELYDRCVAEWPKEYFSAI